MWIFTVHKLGWDTHPPCPVHAGIQMTTDQRGRYASYWNALLLQYNFIIVHYFFNFTEALVNL